MKAIWKYSLTGAKNQTLHVPEGATARSVQTMDGQPVIWFETNPLAVTKTERLIQCFGTGESFNPQGLHYLGTAQIDAFVLHYFEKEKV